MPRLRIHPGQGAYETSLVEEYIIYTNVNLLSDVVEEVNTQEIFSDNIYERSLLFIQGIGRHVGIEPAGIREAIEAGLISVIDFNSMTSVNNTGTHVGWLTDEDAACISRSYWFANLLYRGPVWAFYTKSRALVEKASSQFRRLSALPFITMGWVTSTGLKWWTVPVDNVDPYPTELSAERGWQVVSIGSRISEGVILAPTDLSMSHYLQRLMAHGVNRGLLPTYSPTEVYMAELGDKTIIIMPWRVLNTRGRYYPVSPRGREAERVNMSSSPNLIYSHDGNNIHRYLDIVGGIVAYNRDSNTPTFTARMVDGTAR